jgi:hypothetical protein
LALDETDCGLINNQFDYITLFADLVNQFKSHKNPVPEFILESDKNKKISSLEQFFDINEENFLVTNRDFSTNYWFNWINGSATLMKNGVNLLIYNDLPDLPHLNHKISMIKIELLKTVETLKNKLYKKTGIISREQTLVFKDKILKNDNHLAQYSIEGKSKLTLMLKLRAESLWEDEYKGGLHLKKEINHQGGEITSKLLELIIPPGAIYQNTNFEIEQSFKYFEIPVNVKKLSPIFELLPHSLKFKKSITLKLRMKDLSSLNVGMFLFKQEKNESDRELDKWSVYFPSRYENDFIVFELNSFSFLFLGYIHIGINKGVGETISDEAINRKFGSHDKVPQYQCIKPGLNYQISCDTDGCTELKILNRGYGRFEPIGDLCFNGKTNILKCSACFQLITKFKSIKSIILFQASGVIDYCLADNEDNEFAFHKEHPFNVPDNTFEILGNEEMLQNYAFLRINVDKSSNPHQNIFGIISQENIKTLKNEEENLVYRKKNENFFYDKVKTSPGDFIIVQNDKNLIFPPYEKILSPLFQYKAPKVTDNHASIKIEFEKEDEYGHIPEFLCSSAPDICLYTQDNDDHDSILNRWNVNFPVETMKTKILFEIKSYHYAFLGEWKNHPLKPGLNYLVKCETKNCSEPEFITNRGSSSSFQPASDLSQIKCPACEEKIENFTSIIFFILKSSKGNIEFKSLYSRDQIRRMSFDLNENKLLIFGRNNLRELKINVDE